MGEQALSYGRKAFEFIEEVDYLSTTEAVMDAMARALGRFGFRTLILNRIPSPGQRFEDIILAKRWPTEWFKMYTEEAYVHDDPITHLVRRTVKPFEWCEALYDAERTPRADELMRRRREFGFERGFAVPIPGDPDCSYYVSMTGHRLDLTAHTKPAITLMALFGFYRVRSLLAPPQREKLLLTAREREVLTWVSNGKSAWKIGEILAISKRTVDEHAQTAFHKLGAANRTQAVAIALRDHLIDF